MSTTSGRSADFFDVVEDLLSEVRSLRARVRFHVVVVCREFDWKNDHRLRPLLPENSPNIAVTDFSLDEVKSALTTSGFNTALFGAKQLELLRLPQNLALFLDAHSDPHSRPLFSSPKELFDQYWKEKRRKVNERAAPLSDNWADDGHNLAKLILRTYHQHQHDEWASRCLDLIDRLCLEGLYDVRSRLDEYER